MDDSSVIDPVADLDEQLPLSLSESSLNSVIWSVPVDGRAKHLLEKARIILDDPKGDLSFIGAE